MALLACLIIPPAYGMDPADLIIQRYNINSGLSSDYLTSVWQDEEGYI